VGHPKVQRQIELTSLYDDLAKTCRDPYTRCSASRWSRPPDALARELGIAEARIPTSSRASVRRREPLALMRYHVPASLLPLTAADLDQHGLFNLLRGSGINLRIARQSIGAARPPPRSTRAGERRVSPVLTMTRALRRRGPRGWSTAVTSTGRHVTASI